MLSCESHRQKTDSALLFDFQAYFPLATIQSVPSQQVFSIIHQRKKNPGLTSVIGCGQKYMVDSVNL